MSSSPTKATGFRRALIGSGQRLHWAMEFLPGRWYAFCRIGWNCELESVDWPRDWLELPTCQHCERSKAWRDRL